MQDQNQNPAPETDYGTKDAYDAGADAREENRMVARGWSRIPLQHDSKRSRPEGPVWTEDDEPFGGIDPDQTAAWLRGFRAYPRTARDQQD